MQKIIIKNFGPIKDAEIVITPLLVLIGEQATGKSTIAKLIYFFKTLSNDVLNHYLEYTGSEISFPKDLISVTREKFFDYFGSTSFFGNFTITYYYKRSRSIKLSLTNDRNLNVQLSTSFFRGIATSSLNEIFLFRQMNMKSTNQTLDNLLSRRLEFSYIRRLAKLIHDLFDFNYTNLLYIVAGRNATIGYSSYYDSLLALNLQKQKENLGSNAKEQTIDETLMLDFLQRVSKMRQLMNKFGDFEGIIKTTYDDKKEVLNTAYSFVQKVIKGTYLSGKDEKIKLDNGKFVYLKNSSSGQQESMRILQDAFIEIYSDNNIFRIIEEPEAHIFPEAQMYMLELLAMLLNNKEENQMIITTHSPYVLTVINNLMYAYKVGQKNPEKAGEIVNKHSWLAPEKVNAYMLTAANGAERIIDDELGMIKAERIDEVSRTLNEDYDKLLDIEYEKE